MIDTSGQPLGVTDVELTTAALVEPGTQFRRVSPNGTFQLVAPVLRATFTLSPENVISTHLLPPELVKGATPTTHWGQAGAALGAVGGCAGPATAIVPTKLVPSEVRRWAW